jgi:DNA-binding NarL/FixJ family response regulator
MELSLESTAQPLKSPARITLASTSHLLLEALRHSISSASDLEVAVELCGARPDAHLLERHPCDVLIAGTSVFGFSEPERIHELTSRHPETRIVVFSAEPTPLDRVLRVIRAGARGFLLNEAGSEEVLGALREVIEGRLYVPASLERVFAEQHLLGRTRSPEERLTNREIQVLTRLAEGWTNKEAANDLCISVKTVDTHRASLLRKLELRNNSDLTRFAIRSCLVKP